MDQFGKLYFNSISNGLHLCDFKRSKNTLLRAKNDVVQTFTLKRFRGGGMCTVEFGVTPLCIGIKNTDLGIYELNRFKRYGAWVYDRTTDGMERVVEEILEYINTYLIPFFERADSVESAWFELIEVEQLFRQNRRLYLAANQMPDYAAESDVAEMSEIKYYMALKRGDCTFALACRKAILKQNVDALSAVQSYSWFPKEKIEERKAEIKRLRHEVKLLEMGDINYFRKQIERNESISLEFLHKLGVVRLPCST